MLILRIVLLLIFLLPINELANGESSIIPIGAQPNNQQGTISGDKKANTNNNAGEFLKSPIPQQISQQHRQPADTKTAKNQHWYNNPLEILLTLFNGLLAWFTFLLWRSTIRLWRESQAHSKHLESSVAIAREAADAAKKSAEVAETALHISERAYLSIGRIDFVEPLQVGKMPNLKLQIVNSGKTHAKIVDTSTNVQFFDKIPDVPDYPAGQKSQSQMIIRPGGEQTLTNIRGCTVTTKQFSDMFKGTQKLLIWGRIIYQDIFKHLMVVGFGAEFFVDNFLPVDGYNYITEYEPEKEQR